ncbi:conserved repeat domain-containing protein [Paenibacillus sp. UNCCL117]|uniref:DUF11 domain-containing protein n=1 Tax=unclassified Paenibacillus TaxID=185978 RepID=UPI0008862A9C|nr:MULTISPECIES: DUF11 domain-containing protein [unclassified Paenibacillus]SDE23825.1 conserved repeat domain-containing protein [Paenibacillus sp. cl123]SFW42485.1 conserved repeat domain-containing protein [Paenibacillus sp. UNCCL117]
MTPEPQEPLKPQIIRNQTVVRFHSGEYSRQTYSNIVETPVIGPVIAVSKSTDTEYAAIGKPIYYRILVTNQGNREAEVRLFDAPPEGTRLVPGSIIVNGAPVPGAQLEAGIGLGVLRPPGSARISFQLMLDSLPVSGQVRNQARAEYAFRTGSGRSVTGTARSNVVEIPVKELQVTVTKRVSSAHAFVGDLLVYGVTVVNEGGNLLHNVRLLDELPDSTAFVPGSVTVGQHYQPFASPDSGIELPPIQPGQTVDIGYRAVVRAFPPSGLLVNRAELAYEAGGGTYRQSSNPAETSVWAAALQLVKEADRKLAAPGETLSYRITATNTGNRPAEAVLTDKLPAGVLFVRGSVLLNDAPQPNLHPEGGIPLGLLQPGESGTVVFNVSVPALQGNLPSDPAIVNIAQAGYSFQLPDERIVSDRVSSGAAATELVSPVITLTLTAQPFSAEPGDQVTFTGVVVNTGNTAASVTLQDLLVPGTSPVRGSMRISGPASRPEATISSLTPGSDPALGVWLGELAPQQSAEVSYRARIDSPTSRERITAYWLAAYSFSVQDRIFSGTTYSNAGDVWIFSHEE